MSNRQNHLLFRLFRVVCSQIPSSLVRYLLLLKPNQKHVSAVIVQLLELHHVCHVFLQRNILKFIYKHLFSITLPLIVGGSINEISILDPGFNQWGPI